MNRDRYMFVCQESEAGRDALIAHGREEGLVQGCAGDHLQVKTPEGAMRCWDYHECEERGRDPGEFPWR